MLSAVDQHQPARVDAAAPDSSAPSAGRRERQSHGDRSACHQSATRRRPAQPQCRNAHAMRFQPGNDMPSTASARLRRLEHVVRVAEFAGDRDHAVLDHVVAVVLREALQHGLDAVARAGAFARARRRRGTPARRARGTGGRAAARSTGRIDQFDILDRFDQRAAFDPGIVFRHLRAASMPSGASPGCRSATRARSGDFGRNCSRMPPARQRCGAALRRAVPRRRRAARGSGSARSGGNIRARRPRACRLRAPPGPGSGSCRGPGRWSWRDGPGPAARRPSASPASIAAATARLVEARAGAHLPGVVKSTTSMRTGPSVWVCRMKRPSIFSAEPSSTVSTTASPSSLATGAG